MVIKSYRDLHVWQKRMDLVVECYRISRQFPRDELYGLTSQLRRAAVSVPANIAEGHSRPQTQEFLRFLGYALGSLAEIETHLELARRLEFVTASDSLDFEEQTGELGRMIRALVHSLQRSLTAKPNSASASPSPETNPP